MGLTGGDDLLWGTYGLLFHMVTEQRPKNEPRYKKKKKKIAGGGGLGLLVETGVETNVFGPSFRVWTFVMMGTCCVGGERLGDCGGLVACFLGGGRF